MPVTIREDLELHDITTAEQPRLMKLMKRIYLPVYHHLWKDGGRWYLEAHYSLANLKKELSEPQTAYYFVVYNGTAIGILRMQWRKTLDDIPDKSGAKLHRIYLDPEVQGKGIGKTLMQWVAEQARQQDCTLLWLEVMDTQEQALEFYKKMGFQTGSPTRLVSEALYDHLKGMYIMWKVL